MTVWGHTEAGEPVHRFTIATAGIEADIMTFGAAITALRIPDPAGRVANIVLGLPDVAAYEAHSPHFGAIAGRYANRIAHGRFTLDGQDYQITRSNGAHALHGGTKGFGKRVWTVDEAGPQRLVLSYISPDGEEGFPGTLHATVTYTAEPGALRIGYTATTDRPTVLNLTNHSYFNLSGEGSGSILGHILEIPADHFLPVDPSMIPTGERRPVTGTAFDFRSPIPIGAHIRDGDPQLVHGQGYDHCWILGDPTPEPRPAAHLTDPASGRSLTVLTTEPGVQVYTGNQLTASLTGPSGRAYRQGDGVCLETQHFPDTPNQPTFPETIFHPNTTFRSTTIFDTNPHSGAMTPPAAGKPFR